MATTDCGWTPRTHKGVVQSTQKCFRIENNILPCGNTGGWGEEGQFPCINHWVSGRSWVQLSSWILFSFVSFCFFCFSSHIRAFSAEITFTVIEKKFKN